MNYKLVASRPFLKGLKKLPANTRKKMEKALIELRRDPHSFPNSKRLVNAEIGKFRIRAGDYRLRYDIVGSEIRLHIVLHRKDVYKK